MPRKGLIGRTTPLQLKEDTLIELFRSLPRFFPRIILPDWGISKTVLGILAVEEYSLECIIWITDVWETYIIGNLILNRCHVANMSISSKKSQNTWIKYVQYCSC